jgi:molecular chaperone GrpE (heat shock protein)
MNKNRVMTMNISKLKNKSLTKLKVAGTSLGMTALMFSHVAWSDTVDENFKSLAKELEIMKSVLTTAFKHSSADQKVKVRRLETNYLAGQGVIYNIDVSTRKSWFVGIHDPDRFSASFPDGSLNIPPPPAPVPAPTNPLLSEEKGSIIEDILAPSSFSLSDDLADENVLKLREKQIEARSLAFKMRNQAREIQDLKFEMAQVATEKRQKELAETLSSLESKTAKLHKQRDILKAAANELAEKNRLKRKQQEAALAKANNEFISDFEINIADNLCRFGSGLRALPNDEHITFVLDDFNSALNPDAKDRIYVFTAADVKRCVQEKINTSDLLAKAVVYDF